MRMDRADVLKLKEVLEYDTKMLQIAEKNYIRCKEQLEKTKTNFRLAEVEYVIGSVLQKNCYERLTQKEVELYLTHCLNVIHGNVDGVVLDIEKE